ncbi:uncharacterized protein LOC128549251 [Mercenaria mercenaria]|uniref:uncharacterized protein LOC128549251 n=1 Tax=Mercenaria mercenaria TaxID=6596 RepID=UPI00234F64A5|nr:uncharacterized protein LOC128549251 [Mercenaria mercenaria]
MYALYKTIEWGDALGEERECFIHRTCPFSTIWSKLLKDIYISISGQASENVAFHVYLSSERCLGNHETIVFDTEETDIGGSYNSHDGIFDTPITGTYVFTHTLIPKFHKWVQTEIVVDGAVKGVIVADTEEAQDYHPASVTIVVNVNAGQHVFVRRRRGSGGCDIASEFDVSYTTFSGWFLF